MRQRGRPRKTWKEVVDKDIFARVMLWIVVNGGE